MNLSDRHQLRRQLFDHARVLDAAARQRYLDQACVEPALRAEVDKLLSQAADLADPIAHRIQRAAGEIAIRFELPEQLGPYRILRLLGEGGMGSVWLAERSDGEYRQQVAIKLIRGHASPRAIERLRRERQVLAGFEHPSIARLLDGGTTPQGEPYIVMEYVDGQPLAEWLRTRSPDLHARLRLFIELCRAVHYAHQRLVVHCDLKPSNVLVRADDAPILLDFGIARLIDASDDPQRSATFAATPAYASPEQLQRQPVTVATDVFGLGMTLYHLLVGAVPERRPAEPQTELPAPSQFAAAVDPPAPAVAAHLLRGDLDSIVRRAVRSESGHRYGSAAELGDEIQSWLEGRPVRARGTHRYYVFGKFLRRNRAAVAFGATAVLGLLGLSLAVIQQNSTIAAALSRAEQEAAAANTSVAFLEGLFGELDPARHPGRRLQARELVDLGSARLDAMAGADQRVRARLAFSLARLYLGVGAPDSALRLLDQALALQPEPESELGLQIQAERVGALLTALRHADAVDAADRLLEQTRLADYPVLQADTLSRRGIARQNLAPGTAPGLPDYHAAEAIYRAQGVAGEAGLRTLVFRYALAAETTGDYAQALQRYQQAAGMQEAAHGPKHPSVLSNRFGVGKLLVMLGRNEEARTVLDELLAVSLEVHGDNTEPVQRATAELASAQRNLGEFEEARRLYARAMAISDHINPGRDTVQDSLHLANQAIADEMRGALEDARSGYAEGLRIRTQIYGEQSLWAANSHHLLARVELAAGRVDAAWEHIARARAIRTAHLPPAHFERRMTEALWAEIAAIDGQRVDLSDVIALLEGSPPAPIRTRTAVHRAVAAAHAVAGDYAAAIDARRAEIDTLLQAHPGTHPIVAEARLGLAEVEFRAGDRRAAAATLALASAAVAAGHARESPAHSRVATLSQALAELR